MDNYDIAGQMQRDRDRVNFERSFAYIGPFYTACLLKQMQGVPWTDEEILAEILETRSKIFNAL